LVARSSCHMSSAMRFTQPGELTATGSYRGS
jgi:hypothetical protein